MPPKRHKPDFYEYPADLFGDGPEWVGSWDKWAIARRAEKSATNNTVPILPLETIAQDVLIIKVAENKNSASTLDT